MRKNFLLLSLTFLSIWMSIPVFSQDDEKSTLIGNPLDDESAANIVADNAGNTYVGGMQNRKALIVKQNAIHVTLWSKTLNFPINPTESVTLAFLDLVGDTVFGCGKIHQNSQIRGAFYFKMNAQTGAMYWSKFEVVSTGYFSCMRYANGKFFLVGGTRQSPSNSAFKGKVLAVSSQNGNTIWETPLLQYQLPFAVSTGISNRTEFLDATEMVNGKLFITGYCTGYLPGNTNWTGLPLLIGISETGSLFMQRFIGLPYQSMGSNDMIWGTKIRLDSDQNLVVGGYDDQSGGANGLGNVVLFKCDTLGNTLFCKYYDIDYNAVTYIQAFNETSGSYVVFGSSSGNFIGSYALRLDKDGNVQKCVGISKPNTEHLNLTSLVDNLVGNSVFINGLHYFVATEMPLSSSESDINKIILDEELNDIEDCSDVFEFPVPVTDIQVSLGWLSITNIPYTMSFQNGGVLADIPTYTYCDNVSLDLVQNSGCGQTIIQANVAGFTDPTFYWSNGTTSSANSIAVNTTDTVFVRVLDTKCCELIDTIIPSIIPSSFTMSLPVDTSICLQPGNSFIINPTFSGANAPVQYLWSDNSTGASLAVTGSGTYWVDVTDSCLTLRDSIVVTVNSLPVIGNTANVIVCEDDFPAILNPTISAGASVLWDDGTASANRTVNGPGTYTISATNNCGTVSAAISVSQADLPDVQLISLVDTCIQTGGSILLIPTFSDVNSVLWSDGSTGNQLIISTSGSYTVYGSNACGMDSATSSVTINHFPELDLPAVLDTCFDIGVGFSYTAQGSAGSYQWSSGSQSATEWISQEGIYSVTLTNQCGSITDSIQVRRLTAVDLYFPSDSIKECKKQLSVSQLQIETNYTLEIFAPDGDLIGTHVTESGWYQVHAFNACGEVWDSIYVNLQNEQFFYLPNSFTPNADSNNERFEFKGENIVVREVRIFNRWGEEIFIENGTFSGWDGTYLGENCPDGIYAVHLIYEDCFGIPAEFSGHVNLIR